jgi:hypothetical protein
MSLEVALADYPKDLDLKDGCNYVLRPLESTDEMAFHEFFLAVPNPERMFIKHRVTDPAVIHEWCQNIDLGRNLPLLVMLDGRIIADATLHQQLGGWKRHIGRRRWSWKSWTSPGSLAWKKSRRNSSATSRRP